jgi:UDP-3-O-[3-hydroxymyristoyl] glucosamine N-acyltransferase
MAEFGATGLLTEALGDATAELTGISAIEDCGPGDLVFVDKKEYLPLVESLRPAAVVAPASLRESLTSAKGLVVIVAPNVALAHALIKQKYASRDFKNSGWEGVHPSAVVHETAVLGEGTVVEPRAVIGKNARIGARCRIMAGAIVENDAEIGDGVIVHPLALVGYGCRIGKEAVIGPGSVIGSEGFGFAQDAQRKSHPIPQTGIVVIEDRVRVGANCCVDRAAYHVTRLGAGTKLDNFCHIAHNVEVGKDCLLTAFFCVAGSSKIGDRVIASGQTGVLDHVNICNDVVLVQRAGVNNDIKDPGIYAGQPLQTLGEYKRNAAVLKSAVDLRKKLQELEKRLANLD